MVNLDEYIRRAAVLAVCASAGACLIEPNPSFVEDAFETQGDGSQESGSQGSDGQEAGGQEAGGQEGGSDCAPGTLDCDDEPGCESMVDDPLNCGSCGHSCEFAGAVHSCEAGVCSAELVFDGLEDTYSDAIKPDEILGEKNGVHIAGEGEPEHGYIAMPELPPNAIIDSALLSLNFKNNADDDDVMIGVHRVESSWSESSLTWPTAPAVSPTPTTSFDPKGGMNHVDLGAFANDWPAPLGVSLRVNPNADVHLDFSSKEGGPAPELALSLRW